MPIFDAPLNLTKNEIRNAVAHVLGTAPSSPTDGQFYYDNVIPGFRVRVNSAWVTLGSGASPATTGAQGIIQLAGDLAGSGTAASAPLIGQVSQLVNGSAGTPAVRFAASQTTGIYSATTNQIDLSANSTQVFHSTSTATTLPLATTLSLGATVTTGGLLVSAGGITITLGGLTVSGGTTSVQALTAASTITANGGLTVASAQTIDLGANRATNGATPSAASDLTTKAYVDALSQGLAPKPSAVAGTVGTENFTVTAGSVTQITGTVVDGVSPAVNDYLLIKDAPAATGTGSVNSTQPGNGLYKVTNATTNLTVARVPELSGANLPAGAFVFVEGGTVNSSSGYVVSVPSINTGFTYGTNNIKWTQFSGAGEITAGTGLSKSGNTLTIENSGVLLPAHGGTGVASPTAHGVVVAEGASVMVSVTGATVGQALLSAGASADPAFGALSLSTASVVTGNLPIGNGGTNASTDATARTSLKASGLDTTTITGNAVLTSFTFTPSPAPKTAGAWWVTIVNQTTGAVEYPDIVVNQSLNTPVTGPANQITVSFGIAPANGLVYTVLAVG